MPKRITELEERLKQLTRKLETPYPVVEIPHPAKEYVAQIPIIQDFDRMTCVTAMLMWSPDVQIIDY